MIGPRLSRWIKAADQSNPAQGGGCFPVCPCAVLVLTSTWWRIDQAYLISYRLLLQTCSTIQAPPPPKGRVDMAAMLRRSPNSKLQRWGGCWFEPCFVPVSSSGFRLRVAFAAWWRRNARARPCERRWFKSSSSRGMQPTPQPESRAHAP